MTHAQRVLASLKLGADDGTLGDDELTEAALKMVDAGDLSCDEAAAILEGEKNFQAEERQ